MTVTSGWYDDDRATMFYRFEQQWTWQEYYDARDKIRSLLDTVDYPVDQIYDFSGAAAPPSSILTQFRNVAVKSHDNASGLIVVIGSNGLIEALARAIGTAVNMTIEKFDITYINDKRLLDRHLRARREIHRSRLDRSAHPK